MIQTIKAECNGRVSHEFTIPLPFYWFSIKNCCPKCRGDIKNIKYGEDITFQELAAGLNSKLKETDD